MSQEKYIGMDVHQATISVAVMDGDGKLLMECLLETKAATILLTPEKANEKRTLTLRGFFVNNGLARGFVARCRLL